MTPDPIKKKLTIGKRHKTILLWVAIVSLLLVGLLGKFLAGQYYWENKPHTPAQDLLIWGCLCIFIIGGLSLFFCFYPKTMEVEDNNKDKK